MAPTQTLLLLSLLILGQASRCTAKIEWGPCKEGEFNTTLAIQCGTLRVPLDYTDPTSQKTLDLELVRIPAPVQPARGSIQLNFGGPGAPTRGTAVAAGSLLHALSGSVYDLVALDPRGTGTTLPFVCTDDAFTIGQILNEGRSSLESDTAAQRLWERSKVDANICQASGNGNTTGEFIGTAFVARDMMRVAEALGEDGMLRFWGFSYGTTLGATLAAMFPDKIDKMVIDGVQNPHEYYHADADYEEWTDSDAVFTHFFTACLTAPPGRCALAGLNKTVAELETDTWTFINSLRGAPIPAGNILIDMATFKNFIIGQLKFTGGWPATSTMLAVLLYGTPSAKASLLETIANDAAANQELGPSSFPIVSSLWGIHCSDRTVRIASFQAEQEAGVFERLYKTSRLVGDAVTYITAHCAQWPWRAREVYGGDFRVKTKNPVLVASNSRDSHTPLRSAVNVSSGFEGSGLLEVNATGHATLNAPSVCGFLATVAYWINGTLPKPGSLCQGAHAFADYTWDNVLAELSGNSTSTEKRELHRRWWR